MPLYRLPYPDSPIGPLHFLATDRGLVRVLFHATPTTVAGIEKADAGRLALDPLPEAGPHLAALRPQLDAYFDGRRTAPFDVPLDWSLASAFNRGILETLLARVPFGATTGYGRLADWADVPAERGTAAARAVGTAMGANPVPVVVPCHRVVEADGGLGGFGGGLETKRQLLALEGVLPDTLF
ncbi:hypothetical protein BIV57_17840 [Mangrovactinospora gilvigrisea]|uniref:Methylated-DNA--protein-cysteine methyltransferase n=1 Tax=Mangrovactinospora gilvigrisea TaxID=1428644 RepID=A0A1J7BRR7_9ACTN|nr:methylated-DNA--[protein]-cysteine S-methyltransferase [Mangrovactinospora gilvigrisea]OIV36145.1 hypothetical protein BIV57_17840 [Mangrovactinospora gilvigrisea]